VEKLKVLTDRDIGRKIKVIVTNSYFGRNANALTFSLIRFLNYESSFLASILLVWSTSSTLFESQSQDKDINPIPRKMNEVKAVSSFPMCAKIEWPRLAQLRSPTKNW